MQVSAELNAKEIRRMAIKLSARTKSSHLGCALSMADILAYLYTNKIDLNNDKFILSKGHAAIGLYVTLFVCGILSEKELETYMQDGTLLIEHPNHKIAGVDVSTGSLGHGIAIGAGLAYAMKKLRKDGHTYCIVGDGECQEGTVWESLIITSRLALDNLTIIIDYNNLQGYSDQTNTLLPKKNLKKMLQGAGLNVIEIDGHNLEEIARSIEDDSKTTKVILASTIKGKGVSFMENKFEWHYKNPNEQELRIALDELK